MKADRATRTKLPNTPEEVVAGFSSVIGPPPQGLGVTVVGFYYDRDDATDLLAALRAYRGSS